MGLLRAILDWIELKRIWLDDWMSGRPTCASTRDGRAIRRSGKWPSARREHLRIDPRCRWCGSAAKLQVHHIHPFHIAPELELDQKNMITLCDQSGNENCHLIHGHNGDWKSFNPRVVRDCLEHRLRHNKKV